jgi:2,3-dihydroxybiphenyl 1,2-dioxygenase
MTAVTQLGYLGLSARDLGEWESYATTTLGLQPTSRDPDGALRLRMDAYHHRFTLHPDGKDDLAYAGWEVAGAAALAELAANLEAAGTPVTAGTRQEAEQRRVSGLVKFTDPDGHPGELYWGPLEQSADAGAGFVTGNLGLGHVVLAVDSVDRAMAFYTGVLGMRVSDYVTMGRMRLGFLHCNPRHHSLAFVEQPGAAKRVHHFMVQRESLDDVGRTYDEVQRSRIRLLTTLGRHTNDQMVSFYMANPSGFGVEYGWGGREVDDATWCVEHLDSGSVWGHKPAPPPVEG